MLCRTLTKRAGLLLFVLLLALPTLNADFGGRTAAAAQDETIDDLLSFAGDVVYAAPLYASIRTDEAYLRQLDALQLAVQSSLPPSMLGSSGTTSIFDLLDVAAGEIAGAGFATDVRPWLGDTVAFALFSFDGTIAYGSGLPAPIAFYIQVTDRTAAASAVERFLGQNSNWQRVDSGTDTQFVEVGPAWPTRVVVRDDAMIIASGTAAVEIENPTTARLSDYAPFTAAFESLPGTDYGMAFYLDLPTLLSYQLANSYQSRQDKLILASLLKTFGPLAAGVTITDDSVIVDGALSPGNLTGLETLGLDIGGDFQIAPEFRVNAPAEAALVVHGTGVGGALDFLERNLDGLLALPMLETSLADPIVGLVEQVSDIVFSNLSGVTLNTVLQTWTEGDFIFFVLPGETAATAAATPTAEFAVILQASSADLSEQTMQTLARDLPLTLRGLSSYYSYLLYREDMVLGRPAITVYQPNPRGGTPWVDLLTLTANDEALVLGTPAAVRAALRAMDLDLPEDQMMPPGHSLADPGLVAFVDVDRALPLISGLRFQQPELYNTLVNAFESASFSYAIAESGATVVRVEASLTLEPAALTQTAAPTPLVPTPTASAAPEASTTRIGSLVMAENLDVNGCALEPLETPSSSLDVVYVVAEGSKVTSGTTVWVRWYLDDVLYDESDEVTADQDYSNVCVAFSLEAATIDSLRAGTYRAEFVVDGVPDGSIEFTLE